MEGLSTPQSTLSQTLLLLLLQPWATDSPYGNVFLIPRTSSLRGPGEASGVALSSLSGQAGGLVCPFPWLLRGHGHTLLMAVSTEEQDTI